ncbi:MAG: HIT family protein [Hyphomicrobiales bacterium]|nr:HIT family protein [Hyphomicrobiales bacterium]
MTEFRLDPRLETDTVFVLDLPLSRVLAMRGVDHPWAIVVPRRDGLVELVDLDGEARERLSREIDAVAMALRAETGAEKLNVAALGNVVSQLHIHVIGRFRDDPAWPNPVWGRPPERPMDAAALDRLVAGLRRRLA